MKKQILALLLAFVLLLASALVSCGNESADMPDADDDKVTDGAEENEEIQDEDEIPAQPIEGGRRDYYKNPKALYAQLSKNEIAFTVDRARVTGYNEDQLPEELIFIESAQMLRDRVEKTCCVLYQRENELLGVPGALTEEGREIIEYELEKPGYAGKNEAFFAEKTVIPFYEGTPDSSYLIRVERVVKQGNELVIVVQYGRRVIPGAGDLPAVSYLQYFVAVDKKDVEGIESIKLFVVPLNDARMPKEDK